MQVLKSNKYRQHKYTLIKRSSKTKFEGVLSAPKSKLLDVLEQVDHEISAT